MTEKELLCHCSVAEQLFIAHSLAPRRLHGIGRGRRFGHWRLCGTGVLVGTRVSHAYLMGVRANTDYGLRLARRRNKSHVTSPLPPPNAWHNVIGAVRVRTKIGPRSLTTTGWRVANESSGGGGVTDRTGNAVYGDRQNTRFGGDKYGKTSGWCHCGRSRYADRTCELGTYRTSAVAAVIGRWCDERRRRPRVGRGHCERCQRRQVVAATVGVSSVPRSARRRATRKERATKRDRSAKTDR